MNSYIPLTTQAAEIRDRPIVTTLITDQCPSHAGVHPYVKTINRLSEDHVIRL